MCSYIFLVTERATIICWYRLLYTLNSNKHLLGVHFVFVYLVLDAAGDGGEGGELVGRHLAVHPSQVGQQGRLTHGWEAWSKGREFIQQQKTCIHYS
jgi:hypothetical protein